MKELGGYGCDVLRACVGGTTGSKTGSKVEQVSSVGTSARVRLGADTNEDDAQDKNNTRDKEHFER